MFVGESENALYGIMQLALRTVKPLLLNLIVKLSYLLPDLFVLVNFSFQEPDRKIPFLLQTFRGQHISVRDFFLGAPEAGNLYPSFARKFRDTVVYLSKADTHPLGDITLTKIRLLA